MSPDAPSLDSMRFNKEKDASNSTPYNDQNYENKPNPVRLNNATLRVDTPGSVNKSKLIGPGSLRANIFRRGE